MPRGPGTAAAHPRLARVLGPQTLTMPPGRAAGTGYPPRGREPLTCRASGRSPWEMARAIYPARWLAEAPEAQGPAPPAPNCGLQRGQRRPRGASSGPPRRSPSSPTGGARWRGGAPGSPPPGSRSPASRDRSREPGAVLLRAHRVPFLRAGSGACLVPARRLREPVGYRDQSPSRSCSGGRDPRASN